MKQFGIILSGKYKRHTIPWIALSDPQYLFRNNLILNALKDDLEFVRYMAKRIKVPGNRRVRYVFDSSGKAESLVLENTFFEEEGYEYHDTLDLSNKTFLGNSRTSRKILKQIQTILFGSRRLTEKLCQRFFTDSDNFITSKWVEDASQAFEPMSNRIEKNNDFEIVLPIPTVILERLDKMFTNKTENKRAKAIINYIIQHHQLENIPIVKFLPYSKPLKKRLLTNRHYHIWNELVEADILEVYTDVDGTEFHWKSGIPKRYRLSPGCMAPPYINTIIRYDKEYHIVDDPIVQYTVDSLRLITLHDSSDSPDIERRIFVKHKVRTDLQYISRDKLNKLNKVVAPDSPVLHVSSTVHLRQLDLANRMLGQDNKLRMLENNAIYASRSTLNGRLHHNLTNLDKLLFSRLRLDGERIVEIDLSNSQPLIFARLVRNIMFESSPWDLPLYDSFLYTYIHSSSHVPAPIILCSHFAPSKMEALKEEILKIDSWCSAGAFYDKMAISADRATLTRDDAKKGFISILFGKFNHKGGMKERLLEILPMTVELLDGFKLAMYSYFRDNVIPECKLPEGMRKYLYSQSKGVKKPYAAGNDYLAIHLQEIEAGIFIDKILGAIAQSGIVAFTRHDSICCKVTDLQPVLDIVKVQMYNVFGQNGYHIKTSRWE